MIGSLTIYLIAQFLGLSICNDSISIKLNYMNVTISCTGQKYHEDYLNKSLSTFGKLSFFISGKFSEAKSHLECSVEWMDSKLILKGLPEISSLTLNNVAILVESKFSFKPNHEIKDTYKEFLMVYGTLFHNSNYFRSVSNLCQALKSKYSSDEMVCYFIDVIKNPVVLAKGVHSVPWVEIKIPEITNSVLMYDAYPTLWGFIKYIGIVKDGHDHYQQLSLPVCLKSECSTSLVLDPLLYDHEYWQREMLPNKPKKVYTLESTGIIEAPDDILQLLQMNDSDEKSKFVPEIVFVVYTLHSYDCSSCANALDELQLLKEEMKEKNYKIYFINCAEHQKLCSIQNVTGFPTLLAYKNLQHIRSDGCLSTSSLSQTIGFHGSYQIQNMIEWYQDISDLGIHYGEPHSFHDGCNIHIIIETDKISKDSLSIQCIEAICMSLAYSECFILQEKADTGNFIKSIELIRRDGVSSNIYNDGESLEISFSRSLELHQYHTYDDHQYNLPDCKDKPSTCIQLIATFIKEHSRIPVTELSPIMFHSPTTYQYLFGNLPVLAALVDHNTIISQSGIMLMVQEVAKLFYNVIATSFVDVDRYPFWALGMSPKFNFLDPPMDWVHSYPRVLIFQLHEHKQAAFLNVTGKDLHKEHLIKFIENYLINEEMEPCNGI